ncbi:2Fe-2S iron-sulfur cluster-binding protein [Dyadobacter sp. CY323]|uniref:2Fe-2S iron-sulfur cluster-binding protein n=1 Tax=Dyadobacter sp. CY323 TaxID=2907302 RepID=UPI001F2C2664|nr:2Fe-2S iron-sulfur cluster-binding protein [Dyadobacter sp. CY323]MCE6991977.1 (2Fe-2S)-binding protein [Dyadobacter sp. CY323]
MIQLTVIDREGHEKELEVAEAENENLMETLKGFDYDMRATCGGLALCADCHCLILKGQDQLSDPQDEELMTLETRPDAQNNSRLACQLKMNYKLDGVLLQLTNYAN